MCFYLFFLLLLNFFLNSNLQKYISPLYMRVLCMLLEFMRTPQKMRTFCMYVCTCENAFLKKSYYCFSFLLLVFLYQWSFIFILSPLPSVPSPQIFSNIILFLVSLKNSLCLCKCWECIHVFKSDHAQKRKKKMKIMLFA